jgi:hypothetical protein
VAFTSTIELSTRAAIYVPAGAGVWSLFAVLNGANGGELIALSATCGLYLGVIVTVILSLYAGCSPAADQS